MSAAACRYRLPWGHQRSGFRAAAAVAIVLFAAAIAGCGGGGGGGPTGPGGSVPGAPTGLTATATSPTGVHLVWTSSSGDVQGYRAELQNGGNWSAAGSTAANVTELDVTGLQAGASYNFRVLAYNNTGNSGYSNVAAVTTPVPQTATISAGTVSGVPGMVVTVPISLETNLTSLSGYAFTISYDNSRLELLDCRQERLGLPQFQWAPPAAGQVRVAAVSNAPVAYTNGVITTIRFTIKADASGTVKITPTAGELSDATFQAVTVTTLSAGSVQIQ